MSDGKAGAARVGIWVWALAPVAVFALVMLGSLGMQGVKRWSLATAGNAGSASASPRPLEPGMLAPPPPLGAVPSFDGSAVDVSSVMGRARKLADAWQPDASLLSLDATVQRGKVQTQDGGSVTLLFGPPRIGTPTKKGGLRVFYSKNGLESSPKALKSFQGLPEPMCAPEAVLLKVMDLNDSVLTLHYGYSADGRVLWTVTPEGDAKRLRAFDPDNCTVRGATVLGPR